MRSTYLLIAPVALTLLASCGINPATYDFPRPVDTTSRPVRPNPGHDWSAPGGWSVSTRFPGGKLDSLVAHHPDGAIHVWTKPENTPINVSPWYAFRIAGERDTTVAVTLHYPDDGYHRYRPKLSTNLITWAPVDSTAFTVSEDNKRVTMLLSPTGNDGRSLYVAAQEIHDSRRVIDWASQLAEHPRLVMSDVGISKRGRPLVRLHLTDGDNRRKPTIVILSRQHPPEVTGYLAMQAFVERLLDHPRLGDFLTNYQVLIYPLLNPDGVDGGHWRHNAGGVDLNRDWAVYAQPETKAVATDIVRHARKEKAPVVLGLDFHSTWKDVYYTHDNSVVPPSVLGGFKDRWLAGIEREIGGEFRINEEAEPIGRPTSMSWFRTQFNAEGITYEIGDDTPRTFIRRKGEASANALIEELLTSEVSRK